MSADKCSICRVRKLVLVENGPKGLRVCPRCDGEAYEIVVDREQREKPA